MPTHTLVVTKDEALHTRVKRQADKQGVAVERVPSVGVYYERVREHQPNAIFLDLDSGSKYQHGPNDGVGQAHGVVDLLGYRTRLVLCHRPGNRQRALEGVGTTGADEAIERPLVPAEIRRVIDTAVDDPGFNGACRVTFIDADGEREHQTQLGDAHISSRVDTRVVVREDAVPNWVDVDSHLVVGKDGDLLVSFSPGCISRFRQFDSGLESLVAFDGTT